ncbi:MAG: hydrogenase nickel incorporation protein HypB [Pseudobutyrivibrio sp.]|nr:hydrogenase nickel incorporation protein HypB [Pseudobutyrivibrio sp.]
MANVRVIEIGESVFAENDSMAAANRKQMKDQGTLFVNVMSGPGSGKTTTLTAIINRMKNDYKIGEMDVDIESSVDAQRVADATGVEALQIHNMGLCHIDADMTARALAQYDTKDLDLLILENIGNLVCPAEFDVGAGKNLMLLSVPEGDDKPLKYPLMFTIADVVLINKIDTLEYFDFDKEAVVDRILKLNPNSKIFFISAKTGQGLDEVVEYLKDEIAKVKTGK